VSKPTVLIGGVVVAFVAAMTVAATVAGGAGATTLSLDRTSTPAGRVFVASGSCPLRPEPPYGHGRLSLSNGHMFEDIQLNYQDGSFEQQLTVPSNTTPGDYTVTLLCYDDSSATATLTVTTAEPFVQPTMQIDDDTPRPGQLVRLTGTCNTPGETVYLNLEAAEEDRTGEFTRQLGQTQVDDQLRFDVQVRIPGDLDPYAVPYQGQRGEWVVTSYCADYDGASLLIFFDPGGSTPPAAAVPANPNFTG
jgi:hypothetical protein